MNRRSLTLVASLLALAWFTTAGPSGQAPATRAPEPPFDDLHFRSIGPATMGGRIDAVAVVEDRPAIFYVGAATGGLWKTENNGTTWEALFSDQDVVSIGDVAITARDPNLVWLGTGEDNNRQSSSWGGGVFKSTDGGHAWKQMGLAETRHIGRILIDPVDHDIVYVAAAGHLWGPNRERGVFKTSDGGLTWAKVLFTDENTGASDLVMDPTNNKVLYAAMYQRQRTAWGFNGGGPGSGIYKTADGGRTWSRLIDGIPAGPLGRIALDVYRKDPSVVYALVQHERAGGLYRSDDAGSHWRKVSDTDPRPSYFSKVRIDPTDDHRVYVLGVRLLVSDDGGKTFAETRVLPADAGERPRDDVDMHTLWIDPSNPAHLVAGSDVGVAVSDDRAARWNLLDNLVVGQFYHVGYDMETPYHVLGGLQDNDVWVGPSATRTQFGIGNWDWRTLDIGDGFVAVTDPRDPKVIYGETQDGSLTRVDRDSGERKTIKPQAAKGEPPLRWAWDTPFVISPHDANTVLIAAQKVFLSPDRGQSWHAISGDLTSGVDRETLPIMGVAGNAITLSKHDGVSAYPTISALVESPRKAGVYYAGTDDGLVQVSRDAGKTWTNVTGRIAGVPRGSAVSRLVASAFDDATVYAAFNNHRQDDYDPYLYVSADYGGTWKMLAATLQRGQAINCVTEDTKNGDVLYVGTEFGLFVSIDRGQRFVRVRANLPTVPVDEITIQPRDNDLLLATHGRGIWILDDLTSVQQAAEAMRADAFLFGTRPAVAFNPSNERANYHGDRRFWGENPAFGAGISFFLRQPASDLRFVVRDNGGTIVRELAGEAVNRLAKPGIHRLQWDLRHQPSPQRPGLAGGGGAGRGGAPASAPGTPGAAPAAPAGPGGSRGPFVLPGQYTVSMVVSGREVSSRPLTVNADPLVQITDADRRTHHDIALALHEMSGEADMAAETLVLVSEQLTAVDDLLKQTTNGAELSKTLVQPLRAKVALLGRQVGAPTGPGAGGRGGGGRGDTQPLRTRLSGARSQVMASTSLPTEYQRQAVADARADLAAAVTGINDIITDDLPGLLKRLSDAGVTLAPMKLLRIGAVAPGADRQR